MESEHTRHNSACLRKLDRQGSILSNLSEYDILDDIQDDLDVEDGGGDEALAQPHAMPITTMGVKKRCDGDRNNFLKKDRDITVSVSVREQHSFSTDILSSTRLYDVECTHGGYKWKIVRKYKQVEDLHIALQIYRASLVLTRSTVNTAGAAIKLPPVTENSTSSCKDSASSPSKAKMIKLRNTSLKFPKRPEMFISSARQVEKRRGQLEEYINAVLKNPTYRTNDATMRFLEISHLSFTKHGGKKFHEGFISKRSGGRRFTTLLSCLAPSAAVWNKRWLVLKDSYICYLRKNQQIADVMLFDQDFDQVKSGIAETRHQHGLIITNTARELSLKTTSYHKTRNWANAIEQVAESCEYVHKTPHHSFAPKRKELAHWYVDAESYFVDVAAALQSACEEIFITDWWLTPELFLLRPVVHKTDASRLDNILLKKAQQGVKIYILLYKEIEMAVAGIQSAKCKVTLESRHENIKVMRHPDHIKSAVYLWSHHEKIVCVDQRIAFLGGLDLCFGRWDNCQHRLTDLGSIQTVTPPITRPSSGIGEDWKGIGVEDLKRARSVRVSKKKLNGKGDNLAKFKPADIIPHTKGHPGRAHSASDFWNLRQDPSLQDIHKSRSYSVNINSIPLLKAQSQTIEVAPDLDRSDATYSPGSAVSDVFETISKSAEEWKANNIISATRVSQSLIEPVLHCISSDISLTNDRHSLTLSTNQNIPLSNVLDTTDNGLFAEAVSSDPTLPELPIDELDGTIEDPEAHQYLRSHSDTENFKLAEATIPSYSGIVKKCSLENVPSSSKQDTSVNSIITPLHAACIDNAEIQASVGFNVMSLDGRFAGRQKGGGRQFDGLTAVSLGDTRRALLLEPIRSFSNDLETEPIKRSRGKTPAPAPKNAFFTQIETGKREMATVTKKSVKIGGPANAARRSVSLGGATPMTLKNENANIRSIDIVTQEQSAAAADDAPPKKKSSSLLRKKILNNMDKVRSLWRHEQSQRGSSTHDSRKSSAGSLHLTESSSKYWVGKDYVNWIHKDLDSVDSPFQDGMDRFSTVRMPWHDIACVVFNTAATDVGRHFIQRWNHAKKVKASSKSSSKYPLLLPRSTKTGYKRLPPFIKDLCDLVNCQILRSCSGWSTGMQRAEHSIYNAYLNLIENSEHYIYIENQFFISWCGTEIENCICEALVNRIIKAHEANQAFRVYIVLPLLPAFEADLDPQKAGGSALFSVLHYIQQSLVGHEKSLFQTLYSLGLDPNCYVSVCGLRTHGKLNHTLVTELIYVHSKLMIVDDRKCIIGSANINDRSLTGDRDSEIAVLIEDDLFVDSKMSGENFQAGKFCYDLRNTVFQEHLGLRDDELIEDITSEEFYKNTWITTAAINTSVFDKVFNCLPCDSVASFAELRAYRSTIPLATSDPVSAKRQLSKVKGHLVMFPLNFLKDEILRNHMGAKENLVPSKFWT